MAGHVHINKAGHWDMSLKNQIEAMTRGRPRAPEQKRVKAISHYLLEDQCRATKQLLATTRAMRCFKKE